MKPNTSKLLSLLLVLVMLAGLMAVPALADTQTLNYDGDAVGFFKEVTTIPRSKSILSQRPLRHILPLNGGSTAKRTERRTPK